MFQTLLKSGPKRKSLSKLFYLSILDLPKYECILIAPNPYCPNTRQPKVEKTHSVVACDPSMEKCILEI